MFISRGWVDVLTNHLEHLGKTDGRQLERLSCCKPEKPLARGSARKRAVSVYTFEVEL